MKHTRLLFCIVICLSFTKISNSQLNVTSTGNVLVGLSSGLDKCIVQGGTNQGTFDLISNCTTNYNYSGYNVVDNTTTKCWGVEYSSADKFIVYGSGQAYSYGWNTYSDSILKENFEYIKNPLKKVLSLQGLTYNYRLNESSTSVPPATNPRQMGLLAQAVERIVPEVVSTTDKEIKAINYGSLVALLVEAMKEQNLRIDSLETQLQSCCQNNSIINSVSSPLNSVSEAILYQNNPNPFNEETSIGYYLPNETTSASLIILDLQGKLIKSITISTYGHGSVKLNGGSLSPGMYYYTLIMNGKEIGTKKMILTQ